MSAARPAAAEKYPVDLCYMVADLKYNARQGVKICEIQQASLSMFNGDRFRAPEEASIHAELLRALSLYHKTGWVVSDGMADKKLVATLAGSKTWHNPSDLIALFSDPQFKERSKRQPSDIHDIASYAGILYTSWSQLSAIYDFEDRLPGMAIMDKSSFPLWIDKQRMTQLFQQDARLSTFKPKWGSYKKRYSKNLAATIAADLQCQTFVIKPRGNFMGRGVIIAPFEELDKILRFIITKKGALAERTDSAYTAWKNDAHDSFVIEEFVASDPIKLPHMENKTYQPTMRVAFLLTYNKGRHNIHFLGEYWKTPHLSLDEPGDFMEKNKDICEPPYYLAVDEVTKQIVRNNLRTALPILHRKMLQFKPSSKESFYAPVPDGGIKLMIQAAPTMPDTQVASHA